MKHVYKDSKTGHKIQITTPSLSLGKVVHDVVESLSTLPTHKRFEEPLLTKYELLWKNVSGKRGGFLSDDTERMYKLRGEEMLSRVADSKGPLERLTVKIKQDLPCFWLSEEENIILCGKIDWLEYLPDTDSVHIVDFKTSKKEEDPNSLQLPIYRLLVANCQKRAVSKASYWYLALREDLTEITLPQLEEARDKVLTLAKRVKLARKLNKLECLEGPNGCIHCKPFEKVLRGDAELVGSDNYNHDVYILQDEIESDESEIY